MFREAGTHVSPVTNVTPLSAVPPCLPLGIKDSLKEDVSLLLLAFSLGFCFGFWLFERGRLFDVGSFGREKDC
jgi:hypothetical protein